MNQRYWTGGTKLQKKINCNSQLAAAVVQVYQKIPPEDLTRPSKQMLPLQS